MSETPRFAYELYIAAPAARVWKGLVDGEMTERYVYGTRLQSALKRGAPYAYVGEGGFEPVSGEILEVEPGRRLVMSWSARWDADVSKDRPSRVTYELEAVGPETTRLQLRHEGFEGATATYTSSVSAWPMLMSSLKTLLETGKPLQPPSAGGNG